MLDFKNHVVRVLDGPVGHVLAAIARVIVSPFKKNETPHAAFRKDDTAQPASSATLPHELAGFLSGRGFSCRICRMPLRTWMIRAEGEDGGFGIGLKEGRFDPNEWILAVMAVATDVYYVRSRKKANRDAPGLRNTCRLVHEFLSTAAGISELRWYFEWSDLREQAVFTPDELQWTETEASLTDK